jgi:hypothetical protein
MPIESRIEDVEHAFESFHDFQCAKFNIKHSATDFKNALKELDGTFVATRKVKEFLLVRFQNPSIRDFMQYLLVSGELLPDVISRLMFFEQAQWFIETLDEEEPQVPVDELARHVPELLEALKRLVDASSCSITVHGVQPLQWVNAEDANMVERITAIGSAVLRRKAREDSDWMTERLAEIAKCLEEGNLTASSVVGSVEILKELGYLESEAGKQLVFVLKSCAMNEPCDLDDFETLANVIHYFPASFDESELESIRMEYSDYAERYASECDLTNPQELREEASRMGVVGKALHVNTNSAQETLRESAHNIEEEESDRDDDDDRRGGGISEECSDVELDSMFSTLGN